jgi:hypothetical protein
VVIGYNSNIEKVGEISGSLSYSHVRFHGYGVPSIGEMPARALT